MQPNTTLPKKPLIKIYSALVTQTDENDPIVNVLENTIGDIIWTYGVTGLYNGILEGAFPIDKTWLMIQNNDYIGAPLAYITRLTEDNIYIYTLNADNPPMAANGQLYNTSIEIKIYK